MSSQGIGLHWNMCAELLSTTIRDGAAWKWLAFVLLSAAGLVSALELDSTTTRDSIACTEAAFIRSCVLAANGKLRQLISDIWKMCAVLLSTTIQDA